MQFRTLFLLALAFLMVLALGIQGVDPPTTLGGLIGIHGIGKGDPRVHRDFNWTFGCVALTNEQIDQLRPWVRLGTRVVLY